ncbi:DUF86 domain-containing protein [Leptolyngbya sp. KIOST-1]|uniref:HepT-like ribonuclease domain-containing protein n=1 Tax=Leptolyngbya sp. KIOST-1 TaxID=1229172 RepID=UPI0005671D32|nr:DUF86 domain-containing protein [Leptolyngbya sp. KIOST-1]
MSSREWRSRVQDMLTAIETVQQRTQGLDFQTFKDNPVLVESVIYQLIIIGEAAASIPPEIKQQAPELPWRKMTDMRNVMAHAYFRVEQSIVWETACYNLTPLIQPLRRLL